MKMMKRSPRTALELEAERHSLVMWAKHWEDQEGPDAGVALREEAAYLQTCIDKLNWDEYATDREKLSI
jgi:hypothetical protein